MTTRSVVCSHAQSSDRVPRRAALEPLADLTSSGCSARALVDASWVRQRAARLLPCTLVVDATGTDDDDRRAPAAGPDDEALRRRLAGDEGYALTALPSAGARLLAFTAVILAGVCGGVIGWSVTDLQCTGEGCDAVVAGGALGGAALAAVGVAVVAVLVLRAMSEWKDVAPHDHRSADGHTTRGRRRGQRPSGRSRRHPRRGG